MPVVQPPALVLVTGASGFIAAHIISSLLTRGYSVRGTVRSPSKGEYLAKLFEGKGRFEWVVVDDMVKAAAFDEAVKGVDAVEHTASPCHFDAKEPADVIDPAVQGTINVLNSIKQYGTSVKRVVITSSMAAAVHAVDKQPYTYTEEDWNDTSIEEVEKKGAGAGPLHMYRAAKTLAERTAYEFVEKNKGEISFDLATICPPWVLGPVIHEVSSASSLNTSMAEFNKTVRGERTDEQLRTLPAGSWVDVRDLADTHVLLLSSPDGVGRFIVAATTFCWQDILDALNHLPEPFQDIPKGVPGSSKDTVINVFNSNKVKRVLGIKFRSMEECARDAVLSFRTRGL